MFISAPDGDTLILRDGATKIVVRLAEVDAPERGQPYSQVSRRNLIAMCHDMPIAITPLSVDRYGRSVAMVRCYDVIVNWRQVHDGLAWCFTKYLTQPATCLPLEREAREERRGLWRDDAPMAPWDFRAAMRQPVGP